MTTLLVLREQVKKIYAKYGGHICRTLRGLLALAVFFTVSRTLGYMTKLTNPLIICGLALLCAFLPNGLVVALALFYVLAQLYAVSLEVFLVTAVLLLLMFCLYYVFQPGDAILLLVIPLLFAARIPAAAPVILGLTGSAFSVIPMSFGILIYYLLEYIHTNAGVLASSGTLTMSERYLQLVNAMIANRLMWVMIGVFALTLLVIWALRRLAVKQAWSIAILTGTVLYIVLMIAGCSLAGVSAEIPFLILGAAVGCGAGFVMEFFLFHLDYSRTEQVQFEDDDYYYYVKAVPKIAVTGPKLTVKKISGQKNKGQEAAGEIPITAGVAAKSSLEEMKEAFEDRKQEKEVYADPDETQVLEDLTQPLPERQKLQDEEHD